MLMWEKVPDICVKTATSITKILEPQHRPSEPHSKRTKSFWGFNTQSQLIKHCRLHVFRLKKSGLLKFQQISHVFYDGLLHACDQNTWLSNNSRLSFSWCFFKTWPWWVTGPPLYWPKLPQDCFDSSCGWRVPQPAARLRNTRGARWMGRAILQVRIRPGRRFEVGIYLENHTS